VLPEVTDIGTDFSNGVKLIKMLQLLWPGTKPKVPYKENSRFAMHIRETRITPCTTATLPLRRCLTTPFTALPRMVMLPRGGPIRPYHIVASDLALLPRGGLVSVSRLGAI
jgi:hypothetical protein